MTLNQLSTWVTVVGIPAAGAAGGWGAWRAAVRGNRRERARDLRAQLEQERAQAELVSAFTEPSKDGTEVVVANLSTLPVPSCTAMFQHHVGDNPPPGIKGPAALAHYDLGSLAPGEVRRITIPDSSTPDTALEHHPLDTSKRPAVIGFTDAAGRYWLRDRGSKLHAIDPDAGVPKGIVPDLDQLAEPEPAQQPQRG